MVILIPDGWRAGAGTVSDPSPELLARCQRGDEIAFSELVLKTQTSVYNMAYGILRNRDEALDSAQEIYLRVWRALPTFRGDSKFSTWLYRISVNTCLNRHRTLRAQLNVVDSDKALDYLAAREPDPANVAMRSERDATIWAAVGRLPEKYRLVIALFYRYQLGYREIAELLSIPIGTVKAHLNRAHKILAKTLRLEKEDMYAPM